MVACGGMVTPTKRTPTTWVVDSCTSSRSLLVRSIEPLADCSASSVLAATRMFSVVTPVRVVVVLLVVVVVVGSVVVVVVSAIVVVEVVDVLDVVSVVVVVLVVLLLFVVEVEDVVVDVLVVV